MHENAISLAEKIKKLLDAGVSRDKIAKKFGLSNSQISQRLSLLRLPEKLKEGVREGKIPFWIAREIASLDELSMRKLEDIFVNTGRITIEDISLFKPQNNREKSIPVLCIGCKKEARIIFENGEIVGVICPSCREEEKDEKAT